jgi:hypothetical protein
VDRARAEGGRSAKENERGTKEEEPDRREDLDTEEIVIGKVTLVQTIQNLQLDHLPLLALGPAPAPAPAPVPTPAPHRLAKALIADPLRLLIPEPGGRKLEAPGPAQPADLEPGPDLDPGPDPGPGRDPGPDPGLGAADTQIAEKTTISTQL